MLFLSMTIRALPVKPSKGSDTTFANSQFLLQCHEVSVVSQQAWSLVQPPSKILCLWPVPGLQTAFQPEYMGWKEKKKKKKESEKTLTVTKQYYSYMNFTTYAHMCVYTIIGTHRHTYIIQLEADQHQLNKNTHTDFKEKPHKVQSA